MTSRRPPSLSGADLDAEGGSEGLALLGAEGDGAAQLSAENGDVQRQLRSPKKFDHREPIPVGDLPGVLDLLEQRLPHAAILHRVHALSKRLALCAWQQRDSFVQMSRDSDDAEPEKRGRTVDAPKWWLDKLKAATGGATNPAVAARLKEEQAIDVHESTVSRARNGKVTSIEIIYALSDIYEIPPPVFIAETEQDAITMQGIPLVRQQKVARQMAKAQRIATGVGGKSKRDQGSTVQPEHGNSTGSRGGQRGGVAPSRSRTPSR